MSSITLEEVWKLFREVAEAQQQSRQEADRRFQELERFLKESAANADRRVVEMRAETEHQLAENKRLIAERTAASDQQIAAARVETERQIAEKAAETERQLAAARAETERQIAATRAATDRFIAERAASAAKLERCVADMSKKIGDLGNRLGEFVESMVKPAVLRLFRERNIIIHQVHTDVEVNTGDEGMQIDLLVVNSTQAVLVEVKSKLTQSDVDEHLERLAKFKRLMPRYADVQAMGAVAAMVIPDDIARYAYRKGLFVLAQTGEIVEIRNDARFEPKVW